MKNVKYKILVLSDLKESTSSLMDSSLGLAKMIDGQVDFFHVKKPTDVVDRDNQLSAFRSMNEKYTLTKKTIEKIVDSYSKTYDVAINYSYTFGNVKNEIGDYIAKNNPDIIVLGKRKSNSIRFIGDNITGFVFKKHKGVIMVAGNENVVEFNQELSLGILNNKNLEVDAELSKSLLTCSHKPLKAFKFASKNNEVASKSTETAGVKSIDYIFEHNANRMKNLSSYLTKNHVNLLFVDRVSSSKNNIKSDFKEIINKLNVSLLFSSEQNLITN